MGDMEPLQRTKNRVKARVRAQMEHPFRTVKSVFGVEKTCDRGRSKNYQRLCLNFALSNL